MKSLIKLIKTLIPVLLLVAAGVGCQKERKKAAETRPTPRACELSDNGECGPDHQCIPYSSEEARCFPRYRGELPRPRFPFPPEHPVLCTQGVEMPAGNSHSYSNAYYALDLASPPQTPNGEVHAGLAGRVLVTSGCDNHDDKLTNTDDCGAGFGNHIRLLSSDGFMVLYAHLRRVFVKDGDKIQPGDLLGEEGKTGLAGHRHLHMSVHYDWREQGVEYYRRFDGALPPSIPFELNLRASTDSSPKPTDVRALTCLQNDLEQAPFFGHHDDPG